MQLLRAARAACTNPHLRVTSIGSSLSLGPIFLPLQLPGEKIGFVAGEKPVLSQKKDCLPANITLTRLAAIN